MNKNHYAAIMAGGIGSRFWPASRSEMPKQFLDILGTGETLLQTTFKRIANIIPAENIYIVTNDLYADLVQSQLPFIRSEQIVCEPNRRNTAPCIAYISYKIFQQNPQAIMLVAPSDHLILDTQTFKEVCHTALNYCSQHDDLLTLGIKPNRPDTNYGYIQYFMEPSDTTDAIHKVKTFTEKPDLELAKQFLQSGDFLWNAGIFVWQLKTIINALKKYLPEIAYAFEENTDAFNTDEEANYIKTVYSQCINISIDYGILEKAQNVKVIPANFGWSDLGTWSSLWAQKEKDKNGNAVYPQTILTNNAQNNIVFAPENKTVIVEGISDFCIIDTEDVLVLCPKEKEYLIKEYMQQLKAKGKTDIL
ncbi:MAG: mannose-1-phosphate guanylyltransferase [Chitinophagales bacterium]|nr:mannose-1-phosphate guanylyltransferase [Bacteroidota bacterium]MCB9042194.1 mannose-1-phosphate guanylyltransferase [Chitinophagales bacterium]